MFQAVSFVVTVLYYAGSATLGYRSWLGGMLGYLPRRTVSASVVDWRFVGRRTVFALSQWGIALAARWIITWMWRIMERVDRTPSKREEMKRAAAAAVAPGCFLMWYTCYF